MYMHSVGCVSQENPDLEDRGLPSLAGFGKCEDFSFFLWCLDGVEWLFSKSFLSCWLLFLWSFSYRQQTMGEGHDVYASMSERKTTHCGVSGLLQPGSLDYRREQEHPRNLPERVSQLPNILYFGYLFIFYNNYAFYL